MFSKFMAEMKELAWTLGGTGLVLITLSGQTRTWGIWISLISLAVHVISLAFQGDE
jgi:hypothetical protein